MTQPSIKKLIDIDCEIDELKRRLTHLDAERAAVLHSLVVARVFHEGNFSLVRKERTRRKVIIEKVRKYFPDVYQEVGTVSITLKDLEAVLPARDVASVVETQTFVDYKPVFDPSESKA